MNTDLEKYHGLVILKIIRSAPSFVSFFKKTSHSYIINETVGLYIKHSTKRMSPWTFTFMKGHQDEILALKKEYQKVFVCLVCHNDGVVCLSFDELKFILDHDHLDEWVRIMRRVGEKYAIKGSDGKLKNKKGISEFPKIILDAISPSLNLKNVS